MSNPQTASQPAWRSRFLLYTVALLCVAAGAGYYAYVLEAGRPTAVNELTALRGFFTKVARSQKLADAYRDADGNLIADPPSDPAKFQKVDTLGFSLVAGDDPEQTLEEWKDFLAALEKATGRKVVFLGDLATQHAQLDALREGRLHVTAFSTGEVGDAVNSAGFVPLACPADADGKYAYEMEILVPAGSSIRAPADLKGKTLALTSLSSNSGAKAPMVVLKEKFGMLPGRDYKYLSSGSHQQSIKELAERKHDAVCVANDLLARAVADGTIKSDQYRSIYKSASFPPLCLGIAHDLPPELAKQVTKAFQDFRFAGTSLAKRYSSQGMTRFALVDYKRDWAYVREIDDALTRLLDSK